MKLLRSQSAYYLDSYVPSWLADDLPFQKALRARIEQIATAHDWTVLEVQGPTDLRWKEDFVTPPVGMSHVCVMVVVTEFDSWVGSDGDDLIEQSIKPIPFVVYQWEPVGDVVDECSRCGKMCEIPVPPKEGERVLCDECVGRLQRYACADCQFWIEQSAHELVEPNRCPECGGHMNPRLR